MNIFPSQGNSIPFSLSKEDLTQLKSIISKNDIIQAKVLKNISPNKYLLQFRGLKILVQSKQGLQPGTTVFLSIQAVKNQIFAKILGQIGQNSIQNTQLGMLQEAHLTPTQNNLYILSKLLKMNLVFDQTFFNFIEENMGKFSTGNTTRQIDILLLLLIKKLPVNKKIFTILWNILYEPQIFSGQISSILTDLKKNANEIQGQYESGIARIRDFSG